MKMMPLSYIAPMMLLSIAAPVGAQSAGQGTNNSAESAPILAEETANAVAATAVGRTVVSLGKGSEARLKKDVEKLVSFGTRHTLSSATDPKRGIGAARNWSAKEFAKISRSCGGCITVERISDTMTGPRAPNGVLVENVLGIQKGSDPTRVVIISGHIDSRVSDVMDFTKDAPGANDDGSGTVLVLEAARQLSKTKHRATIVYAILSGEEQGLWGGRILANHAKAQGWQVDAMLNNDIVGGTRGTEGQKVDDSVRVFSEGIRFSEERDGQLARRGNGGEDDGPSRALAKKVKVMEQFIGNPLKVFAIRRPDRFSRGGDHLPALELGYPAIRFTAGIEDYDAEHQDLRVENGRDYGDTVEKMDFPYLARVTALNVLVAGDIADAPPAPASVTLSGAVTSHTKVVWTPSPGATGYRIVWRPADQDEWKWYRDVDANKTEEELRDVNVDDNFFGVKALGPNDSASIVTFGAAPPRPAFGSTPPSATPPKQ